MTAQLMGATVVYRASDERDYPAIVVRAQNDGLANLCVFCDDAGNGVLIKKSAVYTDDHASPLEHTWRWPAQWTPGR